MPLIADLDKVHETVVQARQDVRGPKNDRAVQELCNAVSDLEKVVRLIVRVLQGDEKAAEEFKDDV